MKNEKERIQHSLRRMIIPVKSIRNVLEYLYQDEREHYYECDKPKDHIFNSIVELKKWYERFFSMVK
jgi:hypothetical protein